VLAYATIGAIACEYPVSIGSMMFPEYEVVASWPEFTDLMQNGIGFYLHDPQDSGNADKIQKVVTSDIIYKYNEQ
jgi:hypothetical protein